MADVSNEERRLQQLYAGLGDGELLKLLGQKAGLTAVAQQALSAEAASRGLSEPADAEEAIGEADGDAKSPEDGLARLCRFQLAGDAETAMITLRDAGIPCRVDRARGRETDDGPLVDLPGLDLLVDAGNEAAAKVILRKRMQLFPEAEVDFGGDDADADALYVAGSFQTAEEAEVLKIALQEAGIAATTAKAHEDDGPVWAVEVAFEELEPALDVAEKLGLSQ